MRQRYIVYHNGRAVGWVHAENPMEATNRVAKMTGRPAGECAALLFESARLCRLHRAIRTVGINRPAC